MTIIDEAREHSAPKSSTGDERDVRLAPVLRAAGLRTGGVLTPVESHSNDTYLIDDDLHGEAVLRICWRGDVSRVTWEAALGRMVPGAVGYPAVLGAGTAESDAGTVSWSLTRRLTGQTLLRAWPDLDERARDRACASLARRLRALHAWRPPGDFAAHPPVLPKHVATDVGRVIGASIQPLPIERLHVLVAAAHEIDGVEPELLDAASRVVDRLALLAPEMDDHRGGVIHGDLHLANVWWDGEDVSALLDLEWARFGPTWMELGRMQDEALADRAEGLATHPDALERLIAAYPELVAIDRFDDRMRLLNIAQAVRDIHIWPPPGGNDVPPNHPLRLLEGLVG